MSKPSSHVEDREDRFDLEALEQRVLLSADGISAVAGTLSADGPLEPMQQEVVLETWETGMHETPGAAESLFEGLEEVEVRVEERTPESSAESTVESSGENGGEGEGKADALTDRLDADTDSGVRKTFSESAPAGVLLSAPAPETTFEPTEDMVSRQLASQPPPAASNGSLHANILSSGITREWDAGGDGFSWLDAANWTGDTLPDVGDTVSIDNVSISAVNADKVDVDLFALNVTGEFEAVDSRFGLGDGSKLNGFTSLDGTTLTVLGELVFNGATTFTDSTIEGSGAVTIDSDFEFAGTTATLEGVSLSISGDVTMNADTQFQVGQGLEVRILQSGTFTVTGKAEAVHTGGEAVTFDNRGTLVHQGGQDFNFQNVTNRGTVGIDSGRFLADQFVQPFGSTEVLPGAALGVTSGAIDIQGGDLLMGGAVDGDLLVSGGTFRAGFGQSSSITPIDGTYTQTADGTLVLQAVSGQVSGFTADGATLDGTLQVEAPAPFAPLYGTAFTIIDVPVLNPVTTRFSTINLPAVGVSDFLALDQPAEDLDLRVSTTFTWDGGGDGVDFFDGLNWDLDATPGPGDTVVVDQAGAKVAFNPPGATHRIGELTVGRNSVFVVQDGTLDIFGTADVDGELSLSSGEITGGFMDVTGTLVLSEGRLAFQESDWRGTTIKQSSAAVTLNGVLNLSRTFEWRDGDLIGDGATLNLSPPAFFVAPGFWDIQSDGSLTGSMDIFNEGIIEKSAGTGLTRFASTGVLNNDGIIRTAAGGLEISMNGSGDGEWRTTAAGTSLRFVDGTQTSEAGGFVFIVADSSLIIDGGNFDIADGIGSFGTIEIRDGRFGFLGSETDTNLDGTIVQTGGQFGSTGNVRINGIYNLNGGIFGDPNGNLDINFGTVNVNAAAPVSINGAVRVRGDLLWQSGDLGSQNLELTVAAGGQLFLEGTTNAVWTQDQGVFDIENQGEITKRGTNTLTLGGATATFLNILNRDFFVEEGVLEILGGVVNEGDLQFAGGTLRTETLTHGRDTITGFGTIDGNLVSNARIEPGVSATGATISITGDLTLQGSSSIELDLFEDPNHLLYDQLIVGGAVVMAGFLRFNTSSDDELPADGFVYDVITGGTSSSGTFSSVTPLELDGGYRLLESYDSDGYRVIVQAPVLWDAGGDGVNWQDPLNWSGDVLPGIGVNVSILDPAAEVFIDQPGLAPVVGDLVLAEGAILNILDESLTVNGRFTHDGALTLAGILTLGGSTDIGGDLDLDGGTIDGGFFSFGALSGHGTITGSVFQYGPLRPDGTLEFLSDLEFSGGELNASLEIDIIDSSTFDRIEVGGFFFGDGEVDVVIPDPSQLSDTDRLDIITVGDGFASTLSTGSGFTIDPDRFFTLDDSSNTDRISVVYTDTSTGGPDLPDSFFLDLGGMTLDSSDVTFFDSPATSDPIGEINGISLTLPGYPDLSVANPLDGFLIFEDRIEAQSISFDLSGSFDAALLSIENLSATLDLEVAYEIDAGEFSNLTASLLTLNWTADDLTLYPDSALPGGGLMSGSEFDGSFDLATGTLSGTGNVTADFGADLTLSGEADLLLDPSNLDPENGVGILRDAVLDLDLPAFPGTATVEELALRRNGFELSGVRFLGDGPLDLGGSPAFLRIFNPVLTLDADVAADTGVNVDVSARLSAVSAHLFPDLPDAPVTSDLFGIDGSFDLLLGTYDLTIARFAASVNGVVDLTALAVGITYDPAVTDASAVIGTATDVTVSFPQFPHLPIGTVDEVTLRRDGFDINGATINAEEPEPEMAMTLLAMSSFASSSETFVPERPLIIVPGIGGTSPSESVGQEAWLLERGLHPNGLQPDNLVNAYHDILVTFQQAGYTLGTDLFFAKYDWRIAPGPRDGIIDGVINGFNADDITDDTFEYGVDYLGWFLKQAQDAFEAEYGTRPGEVDVIAHSTGGLVTRSYIQSDAYEGEYGNPADANTLPAFHNYIMVGVPNQGVSKSWNTLHDNWITDVANRLVISKNLGLAYYKVLDGATIAGPTYDITLADILVDGVPDPETFVDLYVPTIRDLLATYDFLIPENESTAIDVNLDPQERNFLLLDLNDGLGLPAEIDDEGFVIRPDANAFVERVNGQVSVIAGGSVSTLEYVQEVEGGLSDLFYRFGLTGDIQGLTDWTARNPLPGEQYWVDLFLENNGDGTVPLKSTVGQFFEDPNVDTYIFREGAVLTTGGGFPVSVAEPKHVGLMSIEATQRLMQDLLGVNADGSAPISTDLAGEQFGNLITAIHDPVGGIIYDGDGTPVVGYDTSTGTAIETPGARYFGGVDGISVITRDLDGAYFELTGVPGDGDYLVRVDAAGEGITGGFEETGNLAPGNTRTSEPFNIVNFFREFGIEGMLELSQLSITLDLSVTYNTDGVDATGSITFAAAEAALLPDPETSELDGLVTAIGITGGIDFETGAFSFAADTATLTVEGVLTATATGDDGDPGLFFSYDPESTDPSQVLAELRNLTVTFDDLPDLGGDGLTLDLVQIRRDGLQLQATFGGSESTFTFGSDPVLLNFDGLEISLNVDVAYATSDAGLTRPLVSGFVEVTANGLQALPGQPALSIAIEGLAGRVDFGPGLEPNLVLSASSIVAELGTYLRFEGNEVAFDLAGSDLLTLSDLTVTSPDFPELAATTLDDLVITRSGFTVANLTLGGPDGVTTRLDGLLEFSGFNLILDNLAFDASVASTPWSGTFGLEADTAVLTPDANGGTGWASLSGILGSIDLNSGDFDLGIDALTVDMAGVLTLTAAGVAVTYNREADGDDDLLRLLNAEAILSAIEVDGTFATVTFSEFGFQQDGDFFLSGAVLALPAGFNDRLGLGGIVPVELRSIAIDFPDPQDFNVFDLDVTVAVILESADWGFTPILEINGADVADGEELTVQLSVDSLRDGQIRLLGFGPTTLGFSDLVIGTHTFSGQIEIGEITSEGLVLPLPGETFNLGGTATVEGSDNSELLNATVTLEGTLAFTDTGTTLNLLGDISATAGGNALSGDATFRFRLTIVGEQPSSGGFTLTVTPSFDSLVIENLVIEIENVVRITVERIEVLSTPVAVPELGDTQNAVLINGTVELLMFPDWDISGSIGEIRQLNGPDGVSGGVDRLYLDDILLEMTGEIPDVLEFTNLGLIFTELDLLVNSDDFSLLSISGGTVGIRADAATLLPGESGTFTAEVTDGDDADDDALTGSFSFDTGDLAISIDQFALDVPDLLTVSATGVGLALSRDEFGADATSPDPAGVFGSVDSATVTFLAVTDDQGDPLVLDLQPDGAVPAITLRRNGFDVASASLGPIDATLDGIARVEDLAIQIENLGYTSGASPPITGEITFTASAASLFEGSGVATVSATGITGLINLGPATAELEQYEVQFSADTVTVDIVDILLLEATGVTFTPAQDTLATFDSVDMEIPGIGAFDGVALTGVEITRTGIELDSASVTIDGPIDAGILEISGLTLTATNFVADSETGVSGDYRIDILQAELFPDVDAFTLTVSDFSGVLTSGSVVFTAAEVEGDVGGVFLFTLDNLQLGLGPNDDPIFLVASAVGTLPALENLSLTFNGLELTRDGDLFLNSIVVASDSIARSLRLGEFLPFDLTEIAITFAGDTNDNGVRDDGEDWRLNEFAVRVTGSFDDDFLANFPFTPIISVGSDTGDNGSFSFEIGFADGAVTILDFGPIILGFSDLEIGPVTLGGSITLGGYTTEGGFDTSSFGGNLQILAGFDNASGGLDVSFTGDFDPVLGELDIQATFTVSFTLNDVIDIENAALDFQLVISTPENGGGGIGLSVDTLRLEGLNVERVEIRFGGFMTFEATGVSINFNPGPGEYFAVFGSLTVTFPGLNDLGGGAGNFAIDADLNFVTLPDFFVNIDPGSNSFGFPDWFPVNISNIFVIWEDLTNDPGNFRLRFDISVAESFPLPVVGGATGLEIDIGLLREGKFPITNLDTFSVGLDDFALGPVTISAALTLGTVKLDADGNVLRGADALNDDLVEEKVFYGIVEGGVLLANTFGGELIMGLSEAGPVLMYFELNAPIILVPQIGLQLSSLRGGIRFGAEFPSVRDDNGDVDPLLLRDPAFQPIGSQTFEEIRIGIEDQIANIRQNAGGDDANAFDFLSAPVIVDMGASLTTTVIPGLFADVDILVSSLGAMLISGNIRLQLPGMSNPFILANSKLFVDLSDVENGNADIVFLADLPEDPAVVTLRGFLSFQTLDEDNDGENDAFKIIVGGGMDLRLGITTLVVEGEFAITFREGQTEISLFGLVDLPPIGRMEIDGLFYITNGVGAWGALTLGISLGDGLEAIGLIFDVDATLQFNTSDVEQTVEIPLQDGSGFNSITIEENSFAIFATGLLQVANPVDISQILLSIEGAFILEINNDGFVMLADGTLIVGDVQPGQDPLLELNVFGILVINDLGLAAQLEVSLATNFPDSVGFAIGGQLTFLVNTSGTTITYDLPAGRELSDGTAQVTISGTVPGGTPGPYAYLDIFGFVEILGFRIDGTARLVVADGTFSLDIAGQMALAGLGSLAVSSTFEVSRNGVVAAFAIGGQGGSVLDGNGFEIAGLYYWAFNTTGSTRTIQRPAIDPVTGARRSGFEDVELAARSAELLVYGDLVVTSEGEQVLSITGFFQIALSGSNFQATALASVELLGTEFLVGGDLQLITQPSREAGLVLDIALIFRAGESATGQVNALGFNLNASFILRINTSNADVLSGLGNRIDRLSILLRADGALGIGGFELEGFFIFKFSSTNFTVAVSASLEFLGFSFDVGGDFSGFYNLSGGLNGVLGDLALSLGGKLSPTLETSLGFSLRVELALQFNTTSIQRTSQLGNTITGNTFRIFTLGSLQIQDRGATVFNLTGSFAFTIDLSGFTIEAEADLNFLGFTFSAEGTFKVITNQVVTSRNGLVFTVQLRFGGQEIPQVDTAYGFRLRGGFLFQVNTTSLARLGVSANTFQIAVDGLLGLRITNRNSFQLEGDFLFRVSSRGFLVDAEAEVELLGMSLNFSGSLEVITTGPLNQRGLVAEIGIGFSAQNSVAGFELTATFGLNINTTGQNQTGIPAASARLFANGALVFQSGGNDSFRVEGEIGFTLLNGNIRMFLSGEVVLGFLGRIAVSGDIQAGINGIAGTVALDASTALGGTGFNINARAYLEINTTGQTVQLTRVRFNSDTGNPLGGTETVNLAARTLRIYLGGQLSFTEGFGVNGSFVLRVAGSGFSLRVNGKVQVPLLPDLSVNATLEVSSAGLVGSLSVALGNNFDTNGNRVRFTGFATLEINTTNSARDISRLTGFFFVFPLTQQVTLAPGTVRLAVVGSLVLAESSSGARSFSIDGSFLLQVSGSGLAIAVNGNLRFGNVAGLTVDSSLILNSQGIVGALVIGVDGGIDTVLGDVEIEGEMRLEINTTGSSTTLFRPVFNDQGQRQNGFQFAVISARTLRLFVGGEIRATSLMKVGGRFTINVTSNAFTMDIDGSIELLGARFSVDGSAGIYTGPNPGIAFNIDLRLGGASRPNIDLPGFDVRARFELRFNTRNVFSNGVSANTFEVKLTDVRIEVLGFRITGSATLTASSSRFAVSGNLEVNLWGFATVDVSGYFRYYVSTGRTAMSFSASTYFNAHTRITGGLRGTANVNFTKSSTGSVSFGGSFLGELRVPVVGNFVNIAGGSVNSNGRVTVTFGPVTIRVQLGSSGASVDGRIVGANVFYDANLNGIQDVEEPSASVDADGLFSFDRSALLPFDSNGNGQLDRNEGQVVSVGGIDRTTGLTVETPLRAPSVGLLVKRPVIVSPLSTVASHLMDLGLVYSEATDRLLSQLALGGLGGDDIVLAIPYDELVTTTVGWDAFTEGVRLQNTVIQVAEILTAAAPGLEFAAASEAVYREIAVRLLGGSPLDLSNPDEISDLAQAAAVRAGAGLSGDKAATAGIVIAAGNALVDTVARTDDPVGANQVVAIQGTAQSEVADALSQWVSGGLTDAQLMSRYTGSALEVVVEASNFPGFKEEDLLREVPPLTVDNTDAGDIRFTQVYEASNPVDASTLGVNNGEVFEVRVDPGVGMDLSGVQIREVVIENYLDEGGPTQYLIYSSADGFRNPVGRVDTLPGDQLYRVPVALNSEGPVTLRVVAANRAEEGRVAIIQRVTIGGLIGYVAPESISEVDSRTRSEAVASQRDDFVLPAYFITELFANSSGWLLDFAVEDEAEAITPEPDAGKASTGLSLAPVVQSNYFEIDAIETVMTEVDPLTPPVP